MKKTILFGWMVILSSGLGMNGALGASNCDILAGTQAQLDSCEQNHRSVQADLSVLKEKESNLTGLLSQDSRGALDRCGNDLGRAERESRQLHEQIRELEQTRDFFGEDLRRLDRQTQDQVTWQCTVMDLKGGYAITGNGRSSDEAERDALRQGDYRGHNTRVSCFRLLKDRNVSFEGPRERGRDGRS